MTDILNSPVRVCQRSEQVYFFDGAASADIIGPPAERRAVLALVGQAQRMALSLKQAHEDSRCPCKDGDSWTCHIRDVLRDAGVPRDGP